jgi:putative FmdB family regulatory protein
MPFYEYQCRKCNKISEDFAPVGDKALHLKCHWCGATGDPIVSSSHVHWEHTPKEVRVPSNPKSVYIRRK